MRDQVWLDQLLESTWFHYFNDVPRANDVRIVFGKRAKRQLGSIRLDRANPKNTIITMNGLYRDPSIPVFVVEATLVHELIHYAHGFNSPLEQQHKHPHAGGVVRKEYAERGLEQMYLDQRKWLKENWPGIVQANFANVVRRRRKSSATRLIPKPFWF